MLGAEPRGARELARGADETRAPVAVGDAREGSTPREGSRVGVGKDGARGEGLGAPAGGPLIPDATAEARRSRVGSSPGYVSSPAEPAATTEASATSAAAASDAREARMTSEAHSRSARTRHEPRQRDDVGTENVDISKGLPPGLRVDGASSRSLGLLVPRRRRLLLAILRLHVLAHPPRHDRGERHGGGEPHG